MVFEGLVIQRVPYKERDLIVKLFLRNGLVGSFYVYGGLGGGKHSKPASFELGSMMKVNVKNSRSNGTVDGDLMTVSEHQCLWRPQGIRHEVKAFYLSCLYFELVQKFSVSFKLGESEYEGEENEGAFSVLSNALFYLESSLSRSDFQAEQHLQLFMVKLLFHLGIMPETDSCTYCGLDLMKSEGATFLPEKGQFACLECSNSSNDIGFWSRIKKAYQTKFQDYAELRDSSFDEGGKLIQYFCHHFQLRPLELKTYPLLFK